MKNDIRTIKTKAAIKHAFQTLMKDNSFDKLTIQKICDEANVNRVTFYNHYQDKYDLFKEYLDEILMDIFNSSKEAYEISTEPNLFFKTLFNKIADLCFDNKNILMTLEYQGNSIMAYIIQNTVFEKLSNLVANHFDAAKLRYPANTVSAFLVGGFTNITSFYLNSKTASKTELINLSDSIIDDLLKIILK